MIINIEKYQGTGNDFVIINNYNKDFNHNPKLAIRLCNRHFGIGADGLIVIENSENADFKMIFYNPDGNQSFCGNGSRCAVKFAFENNIIKHKNTKFISTDGLHNGFVDGETVEIDINEPIFYSTPDLQKPNFEITNIDFLNTGSPHLIIFLKKEIDLIKLNVNEIGAFYRNNKIFEVNGGVNVNFVYPIETSKIYIRTYERGVENETLSCGTGVTAAAISYHKYFMNNNKNNNIRVITQGGNLNVKFDYTDNNYSNIKLCGPANFVFSAQIDI